MFKPFNLPRLKTRRNVEEYHACPRVPGEPDWETEENEGFEPVTIQYEGKLITSKIYTRGVDKSVLTVKIQKLQQCHDLLAHLRERTRTILDEITDDQLLRCIASFQRELYPSMNHYGASLINDGDHNDTNRKYGINPTVEYLREDDATKLAFVRNGLQLFLRTNHTIQELDPNETYFRAVNKPHAPIRPDGSVPNGPTVYESEPFMGNDERLRAFHRHIVISLKDSPNLTMCLLIHELAHTPPNHVCFRDDDHNDDFRFFQWLFLNMAQRKKLIDRRIYI